jgi:hypothetical protein
MAEKQHETAVRVRESQHPGTPPCLDFLTNGRFFLNRIVITQKKMGPESVTAVPSLIVHRSFT